MPTPNRQPENHSDCHPNGKPGPTNDQNPTRWLDRTGFESGWGKQMRQDAEIWRRKRPLNGLPLVGESERSEWHGRNPQGICFGQPSAGRAVLGFGVSSMREVNRDRSITLINESCLAPRGARKEKSCEI